MTDRVGPWERFRSSSLLHPLLFAMYFIVFLWARNASEGVRVTEVAQLMLITGSATLLIYVLFRLFLKDALRSGLCTTVVVLAVLSFGHLVIALKAGPGTKEEGALLLAYALLIGSGLVVAARAGRRALGATRIFNLVAVSLVALNALPAARAANVTTPETTAAEDVQVPALTWAADGEPRDIYYLVFDRYAGVQTLQDLYGFDNEPMLAFLESEGFTVERDAVANYPQTAHSLASTLNMVYLDGLAERVGPESDDWRPIHGSLTNSAVATTLKGAGYKYVLIGSWWPPTAASPLADANYSFGRAETLREAFFQTTAIPHAFRWLSGGDRTDKYRTQYERVRYQTDSVLRVAQDPHPTFTFVHFTLPHYPFVFDEDGNYTPADDGRPPDVAYVEQLKYTNTLIQGIVTALLGGSREEDPIVIVQSDEGPHPPERDDTTSRFTWTEVSQSELERKLRILHAYYFPGPSLDVTPTLTPVNTFRALLNAYFAARLPLLEDRVFLWESVERPYHFTEATGRFLVEQTNPSG